MQFHIATMECGGCVRGVVKALHSIDPTAQIETDLATKTVTVQSTLPGTGFLPALDAAGFRAELMQGAAS